MTIPRRSRSPLEITLLRITVGYRVFGAAWLILLGLLVVGSSTDPPDRASVVVGAMVGIAGWTLLSVYLAFRRPRSLRSWWFLAADVALSAASLLAAQWAGSITFAGGYPLAAVFSAIYARGTIGGVVAAVALTLTSVARLPAIRGEIAAQVSFVISYLFTAAAAAGAVAVLRNNDRRRIEAEQQLTAARAEQARAEERAEVAAHLHDSVLQTLALIQRNPTSPEDVRQLARRQERELRDWLYGDQTSGDDAAGFRDAVSRMGAEVEDLSGVTVEVVTVGDCHLDDDVAALVQAAREATLNAAKHSGASTVSVFGEVEAEVVAVFVKDRGVGFELASVGAGRHGIAESIVARIERHGGSATITSSSERGTEVQLRIPKRSVA